MTFLHKCRREEREWEKTEMRNVMQQRSLVGCEPGGGCSRLVIKLLGHQSAERTTQWELKITELSACGFSEHLNPREACIMWREELLNGTGKILTCTRVNQAAVLSVIVTGRRWEYRTNNLLTHVNVSTLMSLKNRSHFSVFPSNSSFLSFLSDFTKAISFSRPCV